MLYPTPYFFSSHVIGQLLDAGGFALIELEKIYRQEDPTFIGLLNGIRHRDLGEGILRELNRQVANELPKDVITLTARNAEADAINERLELWTAKKNHMTVY
ncbi:MAG: hypothetical protein U0487_03190 [Patescibacteria group bacterium]